MEGKKDKNFNVLIIDDDPIILEAFETIIEDLVDCKFFGAVTFNQAKEIISENKIDLAVIDVILPETDGYTISEFLNQQKNSLRAYKILMSCDKKTTLDRVKAFQIGAQDFIEKPFDFYEVLLLLKSKIEFLISCSENTNKVVLNKNRTVSIRGKTITLTGQEFNVLNYFDKQPGQLISQEELLKNFWADQASIENIRLIIFSLRKKIEVNPTKPEYIINERNRGYIFYPEKVAC